MHHRPRQSTFFDRADVAILRHFHFSERPESRPGMAPDVLLNAAPLKSVVVKQNLEMILTPKNRIQKFPPKRPRVSQPFGRMQAARITGRLLGFWQICRLTKTSP